MQAGLFDQFGAHFANAVLALIDGADGFVDREDDVLIAAGTLQRKQPIERVRAIFFRVDLVIALQGVLPHPGHLPREAIA